MPWPDLDFLLAGTYSIEDFKRRAALIISNLYKCLRGDGHTGTDDLVRARVRETSSNNMFDDHEFDISVTTSQTRDSSFSARAPNGYL